MQNRLFTELTASEEAIISGGGNKIKIKNSSVTNAGIGGAASTNVTGNNNDGNDQTINTGGDGVFVGTSS